MRHAACGMRHVVGAGLLFTALVTLSCSLGDITSGCGYSLPFGLRAADVVGSYGGPQAGSLTLHDDGSFVAATVR